MNLTPLITTAGLNAVINATNDGVNAKIVSIVLGDTAWEPDASADALQNERARVPITSSTRISPTQIHLTAIENGDVEYWVREIGFVLEDGTLLAVWSQPDQDRPLAYKAASIDLLLGFDLVLSALPADSVIVEDSGGLNLGPATSTIAGVIRLATEEEALAKNRDDVAISPATLGALLQPATQEAAGLVRFATEDEANDSDQDAVVLSPATLAAVLTALLTSASQTEAGFVRLATPQEVEEGTRGDVAVSPATLGEVSGSVDPASQEQAGIARFATMNESFNRTSTDLLISPATLRIVGDNLYRQRLVFGPIQLTEWLDEVDGVLDVTIPDNALMVGMISEQNSATVGRRVRYRYRQLSLDNG
jgi:phage-related tail fiber protein